MLSTKMMATFRACALLSLPFLIFAVLPTSAIAEDEGGTFDPYPLRPADTSSPRDTLRSFSTNINEAVQAWEARQPEAAIRRPSRRAHEMLDFSQLPKRGKRTKERESVLLLKEILDRIELPPDNEIPGDEEVAVAETPLTRWTIPNTKITIAKIEEGPRAGEFLFTAGTVSRAITRLPIAACTATSNM